MCCGSGAHILGHRLVPSTRREAGLTTGDGLGHLLSGHHTLVLVEDRSAQVWGQLRPTEGGQGVRLTVLKGSALRQK